MATEDRVAALKAKHADLEHKIEEEGHRPLPDSIHLTQLKLEKLRIKEELTRLTH